MLRSSGILSVMVLLAVPGYAQQQPSTNPIFVSVTGVNAEPVIYRDVSLTTYDLLAGSIQWEKTDSSAKATFAPFKLKEKYTPVLSEIGLNVSQAKGVTTFGAGVAYNPHSAFSEQSGTTLAAAAAKIPKIRDQMTDAAGHKIETDEAYEGFRTAYYKEAWFKIYDAFYKDLATNAFIVSVAGNVQTFGTIGGDHVDIDEDGKVDNFYNKKGYDFSATLTYSFSQATGLSASAHYGRKRLSAVEGQTTEVYPGYSLSFAQRVKVLNPNYTRSDDYLKSLFIPSIVTGASFEWQRCGGTAASCQDSLQSQYALTPFVDLKIAPAAQFRIGVPIQRTVTFGKVNKVALAPAIQYVVQLSGTK